MSNERSPREVCSITIGINGLIRLAPSGHGQVLLEADAAPLDRADQPVQQLARAHVDERAAGLHLRRLDELVDDRRAEGALDLGVELLAQPVQDVRAELPDRFELAR